MANLIMSVGVLGTDHSTRTYMLEGTADGNNATGNVLSFTIPNDIHTGRIRHVSYMSKNAQTPVTISSNIVFAALNLRRGGELMVEHKFARVGYWNFGSQATSANHGADWNNPFPFRVHAGDELQVHVPQADSGGTPTVDFEMHVTLIGVES